MLAVDGSEINLPPSDELRREFGHQHTNSIGTKIPQARVSFLYDAQNKLTIDAQIESFRVGEQQMFLSHLACIGKGDLLTADANYGHLWFFKLLLKHRVEFCIRINHMSNVVKQFLASGVKDSIIEWIPTKCSRDNCRKNGVNEGSLTVRLVRIDLPNGKPEVLVVSLMDQKKYSYQDIKDLYDERWGVEEEFKKFMQRLLVEFFSSIKPNGVKQDFYANVFMMNIVSTQVAHVRDDIENDNKGKKLKYQVNWTSALGDIRPRLAILFMADHQATEDILQSIWKSLRINLSPVRPDRCFKRGDKKRKANRKKAFLNYKPAF
jgi:hypothetical protein